MYEKIVENWRKDNNPLDVKLSDYNIVFSYNSNKIEGSTLSIHQTREIFNNGKVINYTGDLRNLFEVVNQRDYFPKFVNCITEKTPITEEFIQNMHKNLLNGCYDERRWDIGERPGTYKVHDYGVGDTVGVMPEAVSEEMQFLCNEVSSVEPKTIDNILNVAAYLHCNFESIHPFADGNGRVGRTLLNYYLLIHDLPPVIIFDEDKETYYMALEVFDRTDELSGFVQFLKEQTVKTWKKPKKVIEGLKML